MYHVDKKTGDITIDGWEQGIAPSPHRGLGDMKMMDITTIPNEVSVNYQRTRLDPVAVVGGSITVSNGNTDVLYTGATLPNGTWIHATSTVGTLLVNTHYYFMTQDFGFGANKYNLSTSFNGSAISPDGSGTLTFNTLNIGIPIDYAVEQTGTFNSYRYYFIDSTGIPWVSGAGGVPGAAGVLSTTTVWSAITPSGTSTNGMPHTGTGSYGISIIYGTTSGALTSTYLLCFSDQGIRYLQSPAAGGTLTAWKSVNFGGNYPHKAILGNDSVVYYCDGPTIGCIFQTAPGTPFDPTSTATYTFTPAKYLLSAGDAATRIAQLPVGGAVGILVGGLQNNLYQYAGALVATGVNPTNTLWMPEGNTQYLLQANNYVIIFCGAKGNIYLTNGSSVVPLLTVPDYISGAQVPIQEPYFQWGGAMYLRGRVWFSIIDGASATTSNCGGTWSFVPNFGVFAQQDTGVSLRYENKSAREQGLTTFGDYAPVIFAGQDTTAQQAQGAQYIALWTSSATSTSADFSGTTPYTGGQPLIQTDAIPVGTFLEPKTYKQIEYKLAQALVSGESIAVSYRTDLGASFTSAGTIATETMPSGGNGSPLSGIISGLTFQNFQYIQLQLNFTSTVTTPTFCRLKELILR